MDFEELHVKNGSGTDVGVDLTTLMTSQVAVSTAGDSVCCGGSAGTDQTVPRIASFQVYWDVQANQFKVFSPKVVNPSGSEVAVTETILSRGTYVCEVKKNKTTKVYTAAIKLTDAVVPSSETVTVVKLFKIEDGKVEQYHVGAIVLGGDEGEYAPPPAPFDIVKDDELSKLTVSSGSFYFNGYLETVGELNLGSVDYTGGVYLHGERYEVGSTWSFDLSPTVVTPGTNTICLQLYELEDGVVTMDYRTTFLAITATDVPDYIAGDNTNITFTPVKEEGTGRQQYKVDVYYI